MNRLCLPAISLCLLGWTAGPAPASHPTPAHRAVGQVLPASVGPIQELHFAKPFRYIGGQRFILKKLADAEQHFFVETSRPGTIRRLYWIQFEKLLPGKGEG